MYENYYETEDYHLFMFHLPVKYNIYYFIYKETIHITMGYNVLFLQKYTWALYAHVQSVLRTSLLDLFSGWEVMD